MARLVRNVITVSALLLATLCHAALADCNRPEPKSEAGLRQAEQLWLQALLAKDEAELRCILDSTFRDTTWRGDSHDRDQALAALKMRSNFQQEVSIGRALVFENTGMVWGENIIKDEHGRKVMRIAFTDVFRYNGARWKAIAAQETPVRSDSER